MRVVVELCVEVIARTAGAVAVRVASLDDKTRLVPVKIQPVVKPRARQLDEGGAVQRSVVREEFEDDIAFGRLNADAGRARFVAQRPEFIAGRRSLSWHTGLFAPKLGTSARRLH